MAIATYSDLQNQVKSFLMRANILDTVGADNVPTLITLAEARIGREIRSRLQEQRSTATISGTYLSVPSDFLSMRAIWVSSNPIVRLSYLSPDELLRAYPSASSGPGQYFTIFGDEIRFGPILASGTAVELWYYKRLAAISSAVNALFTANPDLYLYATLATCSLYVKDDKRVVMWEGVYQSVKNQVNDAEKEGRYGAVLESRVQ